MFLDMTEATSSKYSSNMTTSAAPDMAPSPIPLEIALSSIPDMAPKPIPLGIVLSSIILLLIRRTSGPSGLRPPSAIVAFLP